MSEECRGNNTDASRHRAETAELFKSVILSGTVVVRRRGVARPAALQGHSPPRPPVSVLRLTSVLLNRFQQYICFYEICSLRLSTCIFSCFHLSQELSTTPFCDHKLSVMKNRLNVKFHLEFYRGAQRMFTGVKRVRQRPWSDVTQDPKYSSKNSNKELSSAANGSDVASLFGLLVFWAENQHEAAALNPALAPRIGPILEIS